MQIAIIGAGFAGLSAGFYALKDGHQVTIFEKNSYIGGLAAGMNNQVPDPPPWDWELEQFYHHWFTNDNHVFELAQAMGTGKKIILKRPVTATLSQGTINQLDSPVSLLRYPHLSWSAKLKTAFTLARLKYMYNEQSSQQFENITAHDYLRKNMGEESYRLLWEPLLKGKFDEYYREINMRWFWARIFKRTPKLAYYEGGFAEFAKDIGRHIHEAKGLFSLDTTVQSIENKAGKFEIQYQKNQEAYTEVFDSVIVTTPPVTLPFYFKDLPTDYITQLHAQHGIGALCLVLSLQHPLLDKVYWLNINEPDWPFLAVVEHTNFMSAEHYNNEHIVYVGDYLSEHHPHMQWTADSMIDEITPYLKKINPLFSRESIIRSYLFKAKYAQPLVYKNHEKTLLPIKTPVRHMYLATMAQVYPWDRGTNYAIEIGKKALDALKSDH